MPLKKHCMRFYEILGSWDVMGLEDLGSGSEATTHVTLVKSQFLLAFVSSHGEGNICAFHRITFWKLSQIRNDRKSTDH